MRTPQHSLGYSASACPQICRSSSALTIMRGLAIHPWGAPGQSRDDRDLVVVLERGAEAVGPVDGLAVDIESHVPVHLPRGGTHQALQAAMNALELVQQRLQGG